MVNKILPTWQDLGAPRRQTAVILRKPLNWVIEMRKPTLNVSTVVSFPQDRSWTRLKGESKFNKGIHIPLRVQCIQWPTLTAQRHSQPSEGTMYPVTYTYSTKAFTALWRYNLSSNLHLTDKGIHSPLRVQCIQWPTPTDKGIHSPLRVQCIQWPPPTAQRHSQSSEGTMYPVTSSYSQGLPWPNGLHP